MRTSLPFGASGLPPGHNAHDYHFDALKRQLDRREPDYAAQAAACAG